MSGRGREIVILRSLTGSDLGIFAAHRASATSKQRAININSKVAERLVSRTIILQGGTILDCVSTLGDFQERSGRHFGKVHKNWRLGGNKLEGQIFSKVDAADFVLIRSVEHNDGTAPLSVTFIARAIDRKLHAKLSRLVRPQIKQSMIVFAEGQPGFGEVAALCPAPPLPAASASPRRPPAAAPSIPDVPPMPEDKRSGRTGPRTIREKVRSPHILEQMLRMSSDLSAPAQLQFMDTVGQLASQLRAVLLKTGQIVRIAKDHPALWKSVAGKAIGFVDGGMANLTMLGSAPIAVRVGGYIVTPGDRTPEREQFIMLKKLISELYAAPDGNVYDGSFPDVSALRDAARITIEAAGAARVLREFPAVRSLFLHGALVNPVSRYTDLMQDGKVRHAFPNFSSSALSEFLPPEDARRDGREANFVSVYLRLLELLQSSSAVVCGVVERQSHTASVIRQVLHRLDDQEIAPLLPVPPAEWKHWFLASIDPADDDSGQGQRITDPLLFRCVLEPGEALLPVKIDRNEMRRAPEAWKHKIVHYPAPIVSYMQPTEWTAPIRLEIFGKDKDRFMEVASLVFHSALLLPRYAFPVGLDIVDRYAKIPNWMSRPINTNTAVQTLKRALDRGDTKLFDALRRMMCGSEREWLLRPGLGP